MFMTDCYLVLASWLLQTDNEYYKNDKLLSEKTQKRRKEETTTGALEIKAIEINYKYMNDMKISKRIYVCRLYKIEKKKKMFGALIRIIARPFVDYEYLDANIYNVTQCIGTRRYDYHALTVLLIINRAHCFY